MSIKKMALQLYFFLRKPFIMVMAMIFSGRKPAIKGTPRKILIIRLDRLGDLVLTVPVIDNLKIHYPDAKITILVRPYLQAMAGLIQSVDEVMIYDGFLSTARRVRNKEFDIVIDMLLDYALKPAVLASLSGSSVRIGFPGGSREILFTDTVLTGPLDRSIADINLEILKLLNVPAKVKIPHINLQGIKKDERHIVVIHPGGYYPSQRWSAERFSGLAGKIVERYDVNVVIIGGPGEEETVTEVMSHLKERCAGSVFTDMKEMAFILARSELLVCNNSGPLHLAAALGVPTVSTMGPTDPKLWWPQGDKNIVIRKDLSCSPCDRGRCKGHECLGSITIDEVFDKVKVILDGTAGIERR